MFKSTLKILRCASAPSSSASLVRHSAVTPRTGETHKPKLVSKWRTGRHLHRPCQFLPPDRRPERCDRSQFCALAFRSETAAASRVCECVTCRRSIWSWSLMLTLITCIVPPCARSCGKPSARPGTAPIIVVPHHVFDLVSDLGFDRRSRTRLVEQLSPSRI